MSETIDRRAAARALTYIQRYPWAMQPEWLDLLAEISARRHETDLEAVLARRGARLDRTEQATVRDDVALITVAGPIFRYANLFTEISGATSIETLARDFRAALDNPRIEGIVLAIDSPGGQTNGVQEFADMVYAARGVKPVVAYVNELGASAAYWIAAAAERVVLAPMASVGSIGVVASVRTDKEKNTVEIVSSQSPAKRPDVATQEGLSQMQGWVDQLAAVFVESVARFRGVAIETVAADFGRGGVLVGQGAVDAGMADELGSLEGVIAGLSGNSKGALTMSGAKVSTPELSRDLIADQHPAIAEAFRQEGYTAGQRDGAAAERERIRSVLAQDLSGHETMIRELAFDGKTTAAEAALAVLQAERQARTSSLAALRADAAPVRVAPSADAPAEPDASLPLEERCKRRWDADASLHADFVDFAAFLAYETACASGRVRVLKRKAD